MRFLYAVVGAILLTLAGVAGNLTAAVIQARTPPTDFAQWPLGWLLVLAVIGAMLGAYFGTKVELRPRTDSSQIAQPVKITRLQALLSYGRLRGQGIELRDILLVASVLDIDTRG